MGVIRNGKEILPSLLVIQMSFLCLFLHSPVLCQMKNSQAIIWLRKLHSVNLHRNLPTCSVIGKSAVNPPVKHSGGIISFFNV